MSPVSPITYNFPNSIPNSISSGTSSYSLINPFQKSPSVFNNNNNNNQQSLYGISTKYPDNISKNINFNIKNTFKFLFII